MNARPDDIPQPPDDPAGDAIEHFWRAAHELLGAARSLIDAADGLVEQQLDRSNERRSAGERPPRVRRIDVR